MSNSDITQNSKEIKTLERLLNFPFVTAAPIPRPDNTKSVVQGSMKKTRQTSQMEQLERLLKLGLLS